MTKKLLITGVNGFIGSNCKKHFENTGYEVFGIDIAGEAKGNTLIGEVDIKNIKTFNQSFDYIFHFAGSSTVSMAQKAPDIEKIKAVGSTKEILEYIKNYNKDAKLIFSSSAAVYGNDYKRPIKEDDKLNPISIYGFHKLESENLCEYYSKNYGLDIKIVRIFSLYGTGLKKQLLWDFINRAIKAENVLGCFGTGDEKRDFVNIRDLINFLEILIKKEKKLEYYNCASGEGVTVREIMQTILEELQIDLRLEFDNIKREGNPEILIADIQKAKDAGFTPGVRIKDGIKEYVRWFKNN